MEVEDSLTREINKLKISNSDNSSEARVRPITTGVLDMKNKPSITRKNIDSYIDNNEQQNIRMRPRAPLIGRRIKVDESEAIETEKVRRQNRSKVKHVKRNKKSKSITVLWESLQHFSKNNLGRSLADQVRLTYPPVNHLMSRVCRM
jgi:hypothetical protein